MTHPVTHPVTHALMASPRATAGVVLALCCCMLVACAEVAPDRRGIGEPAENRAPHADPDATPTAFELAFDTLEIDETLDRPTSLVFLPGSEDQLLVLQQDGQLLQLRLEGDRLVREGAVSIPRAHYSGDCGAIDVALDPDFENNGYVYVSMCVSLTHSGIFRLTLDGELAMVGETLVEIMVIGDPKADHPRHNVGAIGFDDQGVMWAVFGDKAKSGNAQKTSNALAAVLRFIPSDDPEVGGYEPAPDNVFGDDPDADPRIQAYGLRSPWTAAMDGEARLWIGDVGSADVEEVDLLQEPGANFGWPTCEGPCEEPDGELTEPMTSWVHGEDHDYVLDDPDALPTTKGVVWVGDAYREHPDDPYDGRLTGRVLMSDMCIGFLRSLRADDAGRLVEDVHLGHLAFITGAAQGPDGYLYFSTFGKYCETPNAKEPAGGIHRAVPMEPAD